MHYDEALPLVLMTDASDNGVGAVLLHTGGFCFMNFDGSTGKSLCNTREIVKFCVGVIIRCHFWRPDLPII